MDNTNNDNTSREKSYLPVTPSVEETKHENSNSVPSVASDPSGGSDASHGTRDAPGERVELQPNMQPSVASMGASSGPAEATPPLTQVCGGGPMVGGDPSSVVAIGRPHVDGVRSDVTDESERPRYRRTLTKTRQCHALSQSGGGQCRQVTADSSGLCPQHRKAFDDRDMDKQLKCHTCMRVVWKDAAKGIPDVERTRVEKCPKAFWRSQGEKRRWLMDVCWFDQQDILRDLGDPEEVADVLINIVRDEVRAKSRTERYMADEGGLLTPDYIRMSSQLFTHAQKLYEILTGTSSSNLKNTRPSAPAAKNRRDEKGEFFKMLMQMGDGNEEHMGDGIKVTQTNEVKVEKVQPEKKPTIIKLEADVKPQPTPQDEEADSGEER